MHKPVCISTSSQLFWVCGEGEQTDLMYTKKCWNLFCLQGKYEYTKNERAPLPFYLYIWIGIDREEVYSLSGNQDVSWIKHGYSQIVPETVFLCCTHSWLYILTTGNSTFFFFLHLPLFQIKSLLEPPHLHRSNTGEAYKHKCKYIHKEKLFYNLWIHQTKEALTEEHHTGSLACVGVWRRASTECIQGKVWLLPDRTPPATVPVLPPFCVMSTVGPFVSQTNTLACVPERRSTNCWQLCYLRSGSSPHSKW